MALRVRDRYGNNANEPSIDYPTGSVKNISAPEAKDGTPLEKDWANEFLGTRDAILKAAGIAADGNVETAENSQVLEALNKLYAPRFMSFNEVATLTQDIGPVFVYDMCGTVWAWVNTTYFTGYRSKYCGMWMDGWTSSPLSFQIVATGGTWRESNEKERRVIARYRESGLVVPSAQWVKGQNMIADLGSGNWKAPDLQDMFKRMSGTDADTANARQLGKYQQDAMQDLVGEAVPMFTHSSSGASVSGVFTKQNEILLDSDIRQGSGQDWAFSLFFRASNVARTSMENRSESAAVAPYIHV